MEIKLELDTEKKTAKKTAKAAVAIAASYGLSGKPADGGRSTKTLHPGNYCWTHGHRISREHTSATCANKAPGHRDDATAANTFGGSEKDKGWASART